MSVAIQRTDSTHVIAAVHAYNRLQCAIETLRHALNSLAVVAPEWLRAHAQPEWPERYAPRAFDHYIPPGNSRVTPNGHSVIRRASAYV